MDFSTLRGLATPEGEVDRIIANNFIMWEKKVNHLPSEYQRVEYISTTGTQSILYDQPYSEVNEIEFTFRISEMAFAYMAGAYNLVGTPKSHLCMVLHSGSQKIICYTSSTGDGDTCSTDTLATDTVYSLSLKADALAGIQTLKLCDANGAVINTDTTTMEVYGDNNLSKFGIGLNGYLVGINDYKDTGLVGDILAFKHKSNGVTVRSFVPCYRKSDGEIGMYDLIQNKFFTNGGTGSFTKGPDVALTNIIDTTGYVDGYRISASKYSLESYDNMFFTGLIDLSNFSEQAVIRTSGIDFMTDVNNLSYFFVYENSGKRYTSGIIKTIVNSNLNRAGYTITSDDAGNITITASASALANYPRIRLVGVGSGADLTVTINEEFPSETGPDDSELIEDEIPIQ